MQVLYKSKKDGKNISRVKSNFYCLFCNQRERTCSVAKLLIKVTVFVGCNKIAASRGGAINRILEKIALRMSF